MTRLLLVSGSTRDGSTNTAALRTAATLAGPGVVPVLFDGLVDLPAFNPDHDVEPLAAPVAALRGAVRDADAVLVSTPEYAGALPGAFKNLLDWLIGDADTRSIHHKPVAWLNVASPVSASGGADAHASLRLVLGYATATLVEDACRRLPTTRGMVGDDGLLTDPATTDGIRSAVATLVAAVPLR